MGVLIIIVINFNIETGHHEPKVSTAEFTAFCMRPKDIMPTVRSELFLSILVMFFNNSLGLHYFVCYL